MRRLVVASFFLSLLVLAGCQPEVAEVSTVSPTDTALPSTDTPEPTETTQPTNTATAPRPGSTSTVIPPTSTLQTISTQPPATSTQPPTATPIPATINGIPTTDFVIMPDDVLANSRAIFQHGQELGREANVFSKLGDSVVLTTHYLIKFDTGLYELGEYDYLQTTIDYYAGSFERYGVAIRVGLHSWSILDPFWSHKEWCDPNEHMIDCELRYNNPALLIIRVGSNDEGPAEEFDENMRQVIAYVIDQGVIPVIATKADRFEGEDNRNNQILRQIATDFAVPLWDFDVVAETLPGRGLGDDQIHLTYTYTNDYTDPTTFERGYPVSDLTALFILDAIRQQVLEWSVDSE